MRQINFPFAKNDKVLQKYNRIVYEMIFQSRVVCPKITIFIEQKLGKG